MAAAATASLGFAETDLYVSPQGDDGAPGTREQPLATLGGPATACASRKPRRPR